MQLSPHFSMAEMTFSQTATRFGIDNSPSPEIVTNLQTLCNTLEEVRATVGSPIIVSSGYRCHELNKAVGGAKNSAHMLGLAADIGAIGYTPIQLAEKIIRSAIEFDQLILEFGRWVHIGVSDHPRNQIFTARRVDGGTRYEVGIV